jgi:hypothetical protein
MTVPAPKGWKAAYVTFFALLAILIPAVATWARRPAVPPSEFAKVAAVALVVLGAAAAALLVRRLLRR